MQGGAVWGAVWESVSCSQDGSAPTRLRRDVCQVSAGNQGTAGVVA